MIKSNIKKEFTCDKNKLWEVITNNTDYSWRSDISKIEVVDDTHFIEFTQNDYPTYFTIISKKKLIEYKFNLENKNIKGSWAGVFKELPNGNIEIDFTEEIEVNSFIMKLLAKSYLKSQQKKYINDLKKKLEK